MGIKLLVLDADGTIWDSRDASALSPPFALISSDSAIDSSGAVTTLVPGVREFLIEMQKKGIIISLASWNHPDPVFKLLDVFDLSGYFSYVVVEPHPEKHLMISRILKEMKADGLSLQAEEILYIDDRDIHLRAIRSSIGNINFLIMGRDLKDWRDGTRVVMPFLA